MGGKLTQLFWTFVADSFNSLQHQTNSKYPTLKRIARDYLAIQGSATPSERAFSSGGITGTNRRSSLSTRIFEALQLLKSAYRNGHISAGIEAATPIDALIQGLEDQKEGEDDI